MRQYAVELFRDLGEDRERDRSALRLLDHALHATVRRAAPIERPVLLRHLDLDVPQRPDLLEGADPADVEWLERERSNLVALVALATEEGLHEYAWRLARSLWRFCYIRGYFDDITVTHRAGLTAAERSGNRRAQAVMHNYLAVAYRGVGRLDEAREQHELALELGIDSGERHVQAAVLNDLGSTAALCGRSRDAIAAHSQALSIATRIAHPYEQGRALAALADHLADPGESRRYRQRALAIFRRMGAPDRHELERRLAQDSPADPARNGSSAA
ncbi:tetratricopeptide repeat protein [Micromonospora citrea]|uniref:tetratricopeptide repeat protein n=1 Tax=Micromonospora citrea TaxID=47855 RepID=UPI003C61E65F